jgi:hypothetical protein
VNHQTVAMDQMFRNPTAIYRGAPFWAWNCRINEIDLDKQIGYFKEMGMGGFHIHCRTGMNTEYLSDEFMEYVKKCNDIAKKNNMLCWLYDEDRYASGFGGGYVTKHVANRERRLVFSPNKPTDNYRNNKSDFDQAISQGETPKGYLLAAYEVVIQNNYLAQYKRLTERDLIKDDNKWWAYIEISGTDSWWNNQTYVNTLDKRAIDEFIQVTHERYYEALGEDFNKSIPAIFTDEPQFVKMEYLNFATEKRKLSLPFTDDFPNTYYNTYGTDLLDVLPEIIWETQGNRGSLHRYQYINHVTDRFVDAYAKNIGTWCEEHKIALSGHLKAEETLESQTIYVGEVMRSLRHFHIPGHDVLCDQRDYATAKQAQSVAHQYGRIGAMSELYGVTNWDFDFKKHKLSGDWQAALGISVRVHHLSLMSMKGEAKRDYPASIFYQSPWYQQYHMIEDHFARINTALTRGKPHVRIGVIHPIESYWLHFGPNEQTYQERKTLESNYNNIIDWLLFNQMDFDFISEALLEEQHSSHIKSSGIHDAKPYFQMGEMQYDVIIIPECHSLRNNTVERLREFAQLQGKIIFMGDIPYCIDGLISDEVNELSKLCKIIPFERNHMLKELEEVRDIDIRYDNGTRADNILYQMREDGENRWLFLAHAYEQMNYTFQDMVSSIDFQYIEKMTIHMKGHWKLTVYDTMTGNKAPKNATYEDNKTILHFDLSIHDSFLLLLEPKDVTNQSETFCEKDSTFSLVTKEPDKSQNIKMQEPYLVSFEEPNVFLLDNAEYRLDKEEWNDVEDILKLDNVIRMRLGYPPKEEAGAQPWTFTVEDLKPNKLSLRFKIDSEIETKAELALESYEETTVFINGNVIENLTVTGWYVDPSIKRINIPYLRKGENEIVLEIPYGPTANIEACYLLGDFGVSVLGKHKKIMKAPEKVYFGDITKQGYPFYSGNLTYHCKINTPKSNVSMKAQYFKNPLLSVIVDDKVAGNIAFAPYTIELGSLSAGEHDLKITAYGNRYNTFGQLHNCDTKYTWFGSCSWRTIGDRWSEEYQLKENGILCSPKLISYEISDDRIISEKG